MSGKKITGRVRLSIDFPSPAAMLDWVERMREQGAFGTEDDPGVEHDEWSLGLAPQRPRTDVGVRAMDSLDAMKIGSSNHFLVSGKKDAGTFLSLETTEETEAVLRTDGGAS
jgi:hypothetical protein